MSASLMQLTARGTKLADANEGGLELMPSLDRKIAEINAKLDGLIDLLEKSRRKDFERTKQNAKPF